MIEAIAASALPRVPLVPEEVSKANNVYFEIDTRFRRAARLLQSLWLKDQGIPTGHHVRGEGDDAITIELHSNLSREAARAGQNLLSPEIHAFVRRELLMREEGAAIDEDRLFGNALSSMPLAFNLFGPLALDLELASKVFQKLLPDFVHRVTGIKFEHSPGRREERFLHDGTAFDLAVSIVTPDGEPATIFVEVKYSESMEGPAARLRDRYDQVSRSSGLFVDPDGPMLRSLALEQLWREHMLAQLIVDQDITPRAMFIAIGPRLNRRVMAAFRVYENELIDAGHQEANRVPFQAFTLEAIIDTLTSIAPDLGRTLWQRYCDFERVYDVALSSFVSESVVSRSTRTKHELAQSLELSSRATSKEPRGTVQSKRKATAKNS